MTTKQAAKPLDPRAQRTRTLLQQAMGELLTEKPLSSLTVGDITRRATVNRATFYAHFQDKDELLECCLREKCRRVLRAALPMPGPHTSEAWQPLIKGVLDFFAVMPRQCPQAARQWNGIVANAMREELDTLLENQFAEVQAPQRKRRTITTAISGAIVTSGMQWLRGESEVTTEAGASELAAFIVSGTR